MNKNNAYYIECINNKFQEKLSINPSYSLRSYSRFLEIAPQVLSEIFNGKRHLPMKNADQIIVKLGLAPHNAYLFKKSLNSTKSRLKDIAKLSLSEEHILSNERHFKIIAEWEYYAIITLLEIKESFDSEKKIALRLGLSELRVKYVLDILIKEKLIIRNSSRIFKKITNKLSTTQDIPSLALKKGHQELLKLASAKIETIAIQDRFYSASTIAIKKEKLLAAKELIREFRSKLSRFIASDQADEVYQMNIQLFPLTIQEDDSKEKLQ